MNRIIRKVKTTFRFMYVSFAISSFALFFMSFLDCLPERAEKVCGYIFAFLFWLGIIIGCLFFKQINGLLNRYIKRFCDDIGFPCQRFPGIITFSRKPLMVSLYFLIIIGVGLMVSDIFLHYIPQFVMFSIISIVFFSFIIHCVVDGRNYKLYQKVRKECSRSYELQK